MPREIQQGKQRETTLEAFGSTCSVLAIGLFVLTFVFRNFAIPSSSMDSTLLVGDHLMVDRETLGTPTIWAPFVHHRGIQRGEIIVFYKPVADPDGNHIFLVKRVIGVPGDRIHLRNGIVYLNGVAQDQPQAVNPTRANYDPYVDDFPSINPSSEPGVTAEWSILLPTYIHGNDLVVPPGNYFVMGDNRTNSLDCRYWGFVPQENVVGRPLFVYGSIATPDSEVPLSDQAKSAIHELIHCFG